ncbi:hypothetical protein BaRGS_00003341 [Batillaria attramentaria]|uniref:BPTI/Kunitz inhibitor domain-containing protein n=1 Tax=Batillaria attramentaria TaxID=370345 RepID=A0ABD0M277_9CAEN
MAEALVPMVFSLSMCKLPMEVGSCSKYKLNYYFDHRLGHCRMFWYGGCDGNENRFSSMDDCKTTCYVVNDGKKEKQTTPVSKWRSEYLSSRADGCLLEPERGPCSDYSIMWHFVPQEQKCRRFWYGGCKGNGNRFETEEACEAKCLKKDVCLH